MKFRKILIVLTVILVSLIVFMLVRTRDRHPGYNLDLNVTSGIQGKISAGFAAVSITPEIPDTWNDADNNARYQPKKGDTFVDGNGNGKFDPVWIAGFQKNRAANGIHDSLWARTMIMDDGTTRIALVSIDAIGFFHDQVIEVRENLPDELQIDYCMIASTHVHEAPDIMGIWGPGNFKSGVDKKYLDLVVSGIIESVKSAVADLEEVSLHFSKNENDTRGLVSDTRDPEVHDPGMYIIEAKRTDRTTKGVLVSWANHPETIWSKNLLITSDFPHFFRKGIEEKKGGTCVYLNGAIGGLITTHPRLPVTDPDTGAEFTEPSFEKVAALGKTLSGIALKSMDESADSTSKTSIQLVAKTFTVPFKNPLFRAGTIIGLLNRGMTGWWKVRTEIAVIRIGPVTFLTIPGEIYPEIVNGGIESPQGADFKIDPLEIPPLRELMPGKYKMVIGMANDELGYIIPKSEWDNKKPWLYNSEKEHYGEINSLGPETAPVIYSKAIEILINFN